MSLNTGCPISITGHWQYGGGVLADAVLETSLCVKYSTYINLNTLGEGRAMAQAVSRQPLTAIS
jgi:hypothetical protein